MIDRGRDAGIKVAPPSEPDRGFSPPFGAACQHRISVGWEVFLCGPFAGQSSPPCLDRAPERLITNGGLFLPADLIRSIFLRPFAPRALPRFGATMDALTST